MEMSKLKTNLTFLNPDDVVIINGRPQLNRPYMIGSGTGTVSARVKNKQGATVVVDGGGKSVTLPESFTLGPDPVLKPVKAA
jgi:hypothetical protein